MRSWRTCRAKRTLRGGNELLWRTWGALQRGDAAALGLRSAACCCHALPCRSEGPQVGKFVVLRTLLPVGMAEDPPAYVRALLHTPRS